MSDNRVSSPTDGERTLTSPPTAIQTAPAPLGASSGGGRDGEDETREGEGEGENAGPAAPRKRDSFIPLPEGFRPRPSTRPGLAFPKSSASIPPPPPARVEPPVQPRPAPGEHASTPRKSEPLADTRPLGKPAPAAAIPRPSSAPEPARPALPRLMLQHVEPPELIYEHQQEPSEESPVFYRERAYAVDGLQSDAELEEQLETELAAVQRELGVENVPVFIHLALFDHVFRESPASPPIATLSWKNWQEQSDIWVRGVRRSTPPSTPTSTLPSTPPVETNPPSVGASGFDFSERLEDVRDDVLEDGGEESEPIPLVSRSARPSAAPHSATLEAEREPAAENDRGAPDSGPDWQSPNRSGEYLIPPVDELPDNPPSSQRVVASEELIGTLFERMHELHYLPTIASGASYVLEMIEEHIPCDAALIHVFDIDAKEFVVARGLGPRSRELVLTRTPAAGSRLEDALRRQVTLEHDVAAASAEHTLWPKLGVDVARAVCAPVHQNGRYLGAIELGRVASRPAFSKAQLSALEYVCDQFAEFVADRPLDLSAASLLPPAP